MDLRTFKMKPAKSEMGIAMEFMEFTMRHVRVHPTVLA
jgi:hypothetical protein